MLKYKNVGDDFRIQRQKRIISFKNKITRHFFQFYELFITLSSDFKITEFCILNYDYSS